jgi:hypothetical protein
MPAGEDQQLKATASYSNGTTEDVTASVAWTSSSAAIATVSAGGLAAAVAPGTATLTAAISGVTGSAQFTVTAKAVTSIAVAPGAASIPAGTSQQFTATATYSDGSTGDLTSTATWASSSASAATVNAAGLASGLAMGSTTITASAGTVSGTAALTVTAKALVGLAISPGTASVTAGLTQQMSLTGAYSDGSTATLTSGVTWSAASPSIATISVNGLVTGVAPGATTVSASIDGMTATAALTVTAKTVSSIAVSPGTASIADGLTQQFNATATYSDNSTANVTASVTWRSGSAAVAAISTAGLATGVATGSTTVTASLNGITGSAALTVTAKTLQSIAIAPGTTSVTDGLNRQLTATATYSDNSTANVTATVTWTTSNTGLATISSTGLLTSEAPGTITVTASLNGISASVTLTVTAKTVVSIAVTPGTPNIADGLTEQFTATATYSDNSTANVTSTATWTTSSASVATIGATGLATGDGQGTATVTASLGGVSGSATLIVSAKALTSVSVSPSPASFVAGSTEQFRATAKYTDGSTTDVTATAAWSAANTAVATIDSTGLATGVAVGSTSVSAMLNGVSGNANITVTAPSAGGVNIPMFHVDANRSGLNAQETTLTPSNVNAATFGKLFSDLVDGYVYGAPLIMSNVTVNGAQHNVLYVATENDSVYAFDADAAGAPLWKTSLLETGEAPINGAIAPSEGVTGTPVIDPATNTLYAVSVQKASGAAATFRLNALDIATGAQKFGGPVTIVAKVPATNSDAVNGYQTMTTSCIQRAALLVAYGNVYIGFGSCHSGWLLAYDASSLIQVGVFNASPNLDGEGQYASAGGVWMGAGGPVADGAGNVYITTGNGPWDPTQQAYADTVLKFNSTLTIEDYFTPQDFQFMDCNDSDLASGGLMLIPDLGPSQLVAGGKMGKLYFIDSATGSMGEEQAGDAGALQTLEWGAGGLISPYLSAVCQDSAGNNQAMINSFEIFGTAAYFNGSIYLGITPTGSNVPSGIRQFTYTGGQWVPGTDTSQYTQENTRGATPFISANGTSDGILWMVDQGQPLQTPASSGPTSATLRAYEATDLSSQLYNSNQNGTADVPGYGIKFSSPVVANGKVYISTGHDLTTANNPQGEIDVYGLN